MIRIILLAFFLLYLKLFATEEIKRIDAIVDDIEKLRHSYEKKLYDIKEKNKSYEKKIADLQKELQKLQQELAKQQKSPKTKLIVKEKIKKIVIAQPLCVNENRFPKLKLKNKTTMHFKASAFRLREDADIYADMNSLKVIDRWEKGRSFTSNVRTDTRIKITGYFVDKIWTKAQKEMWIERQSVKKR